MFQCDGKVSALVELTEGCRFSWPFSKSPCGWRAHHLQDTQKESKPVRYCVISGNGSAKTITENEIVLILFHPNVNLCSLSDVRGSIYLLYSDTLQTINYSQCHASYNSSLAVHTKYILAA